MGQRLRPRLRIKGVFCTGSAVTTCPRPVCEEVDFGLTLHHTAHDVSVLTGRRHRVSHVSFSVHRMSSHTETLLRSALSRAEVPLPTMPSLPRVAHPSNQLPKSSGQKLWLYLSYGCCCLRAPETVTPRASGGSRTRAEGQKTGMFHVPTFHKVSPKSHMSSEAGSIPPFHS